MVGRKGGREHKGEGEWGVGGGDMTATFPKAAPPDFNPSRLFLFSFFFSFFMPNCSK